jgi:hypothetical protein
MATTYDCGNSEITTEIVGSAPWAKEGISREYFDLQSTGKITKCIQKFYRVIEGSTNDASVTVSGQTFGYVLGLDFNSKTKKAKAIEAVTDLAKQVIASQAAFN